MSKVAYEGDFYGWTQEQASLLRTGRLAELDVEHLIEEIESMGRSERRQMTNRFELLLMHLLKWQYQPDRREIDGKSWFKDNTRTAPQDTQADSGQPQSQIAAGRVRRGRL